MSNPEQVNCGDAVAVRLALAMKRLRARLRMEMRVTSDELSISQTSLLQRLYLDGPMTAAALAAAEHVSQQGIAQLLAPLKSAGLVRAETDPSDRRKTLIHMTDAGQRLREAMIASRNAWLVRAIETTIAPEERAALEKAVELLERLADCTC